MSSQRSCTNVCNSEAKKKSAIISKLYLIKRLVSLYCDSLLFTCIFSNKSPDLENKTTKSPVSPKTALWWDEKSQSSVSPQSSLLCYLHINSICVQLLNLGLNSQHPGRMPSTNPPRLSYQVWYCPESQEDRMVLISLFPIPVSFPFLHNNVLWESRGTC